MVSFLIAENICILVIKNTLLKSGQAKNKISKCNNKSTNVSQNDSVRLANEGTDEYYAKHSWFLFWAIVSSWHRSGLHCFHEY